MLILVGPVGMGKNSIALKLVEEFPDYFGFAWVNWQIFYFSLLRLGSFGREPTVKYDVKK